MGISRLEKYSFRRDIYFSRREIGKIHQDVRRIQGKIDQILAANGGSMAKKITAIRKYRPEIERERTRQTRKLVEDMARRTNLNEGIIRHVVYDLQDAILQAHRTGQAVKIDGLGTFTPTIRLDGSMDILFRPDPDMLRQLNDRTQFYAKILNKGNIGKTAEELVAQWNFEHPDDLVEG